VGQAADDQSSGTASSSPPSGRWPASTTTSTPCGAIEQDGRWHILHSRDVGNYIAARAGGHFTAKEFRTWNATVLMALALANAGPSSQRCPAASAP
jgi:hypothetical protein